MNNLFNNIYGHAKTASGESIPLDEISASDFLAALDSVQKERSSIKSEYSNEDLLQALDELEEEEQFQEKLAGDGSYWETAGRLFARSYIDEIEKVASDNNFDYDLNELSVEEFINFAAAVEQELD